MSTYYYAHDGNGTITAKSATPDKDFSLQFKFNNPSWTFTSAGEPIVYGYDGKLYLESIAPADPDADEKAYLADRAVVFAKYERPYDGTSGGVLNLVRMMHAAALMEVPQDATKLDSLSNQYQVELANMRAEYDAIDEKYGVE